MITRQRPCNEHKSQLADMARRAVALLVASSLPFLNLGTAGMLALLLDAQVACAQASFTTANTKYQKGDFKGAEHDLRSLLSTKQNQVERARTLKLLGICQYFEGDKASAGKTFKTALAQMPELTIEPGEVLDDSVIQFFNSLKSAQPSARPGAQRDQARGPGLASAAKSRPAPQTPRPTGTSGTVDARGKPVKQTYLKVLSNVAKANVAIEGIIAGQVNSLINTDAGKVLVEVSAPGYPTRKVNVNITKDTENTVTIDLEKPKPKPAPKPIARAPAKQTPKAQTPAGDDSLPALMAAQGGAGKNQLKKPPRGNGRRNGKAFAPTPSDDLFAGATPTPPRSAGPEQPAGPDLASQFELDSGSAYSQPPPAYGAPPPGYAQPAYPPAYGGAYAPPPPAYYTPPPAYYAPQPLVPPPPPPPAADPMTSYQDPAAGGVSAVPQVQPDPAAQDAPADSSVKGDRNMFIALLPFGAGQFQNKSYLLGAAFLGAEAGALYYYKTKSDLANATADSSNKFLQANCSSRPDPETDASCTKYLQDSKGFVDDANKTAQYALIGFGALWVLGALHAVLADPPKASGTKSRKKPKKRRYSGFAGSGSSQPVNQIDEATGSEPQRDQFRPSDFAWHVDVGPAARSEQAAPKPALQLELQWKF